MSCIFNNVKILQTCFRSLIPNRSQNLRVLSPFLKMSEFDTSWANSSFKQFHTSLPHNALKARDRRDLLRGVQKLDPGTEGEFTHSVDAIIETKEDMFTDVRTPNLLFNGVRFIELPVCHIRVSKNNTIIHFTDCEGKHLVLRSCGMEGFKNARKGTNVAAQATALTISKQALNIGIKDVRLKIQGLGPGRMAAIKGLQLGGINIISITDDTRVTFKLSHRPKKRRRI